MTPRKPLKSASKSPQKQSRITVDNTDTTFCDCGQCDGSGCDKMKKDSPKSEEKKDKEGIIYSQSVRKKTDRLLIDWKDFKTKRWAVLDPMKR